MRNVTIKTGRGRRLRGFTLIELLVVITIIILVSAVALAVVPGLAGNYQLTEGARIVQAAFVGARDAAIRASAPRGFRMLPDPSLSDPLGTPGGRLVINRLLPIEPAPDLSEGFATFPRTTVGGTPAWVWNNMGNSPGLPPTYPIAGPTIPYQDPNKTFTLQQVYPYYDPFTINANNALPLPNPFLNNRVLMVMESKFQKNDTSTVALPNPPTNWFWNVRIGDKFRFNDSGQYYTVVGPMSHPNYEFFVNIGPPGAILAKTEALQQLAHARRVGAFFEDIGNLHRFTVHRCPADHAVA